VSSMFSALKREGRPLYELARQGIEVERAPRTIEIRDLQRQARSAGSLQLACECTKGTYIRVLGEDIARALGTVGHLTLLRRTWVAPFRGMPMLSLETVLAGAEGAEGSVLLGPDAALQALPQARLSAAQVTTLRHGQAVHTAADPVPVIGQRVRVYGPAGEFLGLAEARPEGWLQPRRLLQPPTL
jgi:tRNA pseudouridine55 synthase